MSNGKDGSDDWNNVVGSGATVVSGGLTTTAMIATAAGSRSAGRPRRGIGSRRRLDSVAEGIGDIDLPDVDVPFV